MPRPWPHLGMQAAGVGPLLVHRASACLGVQEMTVTIRTARQGEDAVFEIEVLDEARLAKPLRDLLGLLVLGLKRIDQLQAHKVWQLHFHRHGAAVGRAGVAQTIPVARPGLQAIDIHKAD